MVYVGRRHTIVRRVWYESRSTFYYKSTDTRRSPLVMRWTCNVHDALARTHVPFIWCGMKTEVAAKRSSPTDRQTITCRWKFHILIWKQIPNAFDMWMWKIYRSMGSQCTYLVGTCLALTMGNVYQQQHLNSIYAGPVTSRREKLYQ